MQRVTHVAHEVLDELGAVGFPKTSGGSGMHVYVRIAPDHGFADVRRAALAFAREVERRSPEVTTAWWRKDRDPADLFVDYNQNARDHTIAAAYSVRGNPEGTVSAPIRWDEVDDCAPGDFTIATMPARYAELGDLHADIDEHVFDIAPLLEWAARDERAGNETPPSPAKSRWSRQLEGANRTNGVDPVAAFRAACRAGGGVTPNVLPRRWLPAEHPGGSHVKKLLSSTLVGLLLAPMGALVSAPAHADTGIAVAGNPDLAVDSAHNRVFVVGDTMDVTDLSGAVIAHGVPGITDARTVAMSADGSAAVVATYSGKLLVIDALTLKIRRTIRLTGQYGENCVRSLAPAAGLMFAAYTKCTDGGAFGIAAVNTTTGEVHLSLGDRTWPGSEVRLGSSRGTSSTLAAADTSMSLS